MNVAICGIVAPAIASCQPTVDLSYKTDSAGRLTTNLYKPYQLRAARAFCEVWGLGCGMKDCLGETNSSLGSAAFVGDLDAAWIARGCRPGWFNQCNGSSAHAVELRDQKSLFFDVSQRASCTAN